MKFMPIRKKIRKILALLNGAYGRPAPFKKDDPVDVLIRTILSQNTTDKNSVPAFYALKKHFASWDKMRKARAGVIAGIIRHAGLANIKAKRIKEVLAEIRAREGKVNLANLTRLNKEKSLDYLESLKGVGPKTAACVLLFAFGKPAMPVDTHIFRVAKRLGLISADAGIEEAHRILTKIVPKDLIYEFHLGIIEHGRRTCRSQTPRCGVCVVYGLCGFEDKALYK